MPARFDDANRTLELSVADLLERDLGKSLGFAQRGGFERLWVGQAIHSRYQERAMERDGSYRREVTVRHEIVHKGWTVKMHGRLDGLRRDPDGVETVEEIKSVRPGTQLSPAVADLYHRQAALYAWMLSESTGEEVRAELVLIEIGAFDDSGIDRISVDVGSRAIEAAVKQRAGGLILEREARAAERERRRRGAEELRFPFHETRPGQQKIIDGVRRALEQKEHLLVEAPTGIGKTVSALYPVLQYALAHDKRVFVLTAKTLQQRMATQVLSLLNSDSLFHSLQLRAKGKMCANGEVLCHEEYCSYAKEYFLKLQKSRLVDELLERHPDLEPDAIFAAAKNEVVCPFEVSLELERRAQATVCDYNYAFDPYVSLTGFREDSDLRDVILVIDEIHNLVDRGRGYYSPELDSQVMRRVADQIKDMLAATSASLLLQMAEVVEGLAGLVEDAVADAVPPGQYGAVEASFPEEQLWPLRTEFDRLFVRYLEHRRETKSFRPEDPFVGLYFDLLRFMNTLQLTHHDGSLFSTLAVAERSGRCALQILCKDAGKYLGAVINRTHATIGLSATLSPTEFYRDLLGFDAERTSDLEVGNPFPEENRRIVIDGSVGTTYKEREKNYQPLADRLAEFAEAVPGNCLALFPSYRFLAEVYERLPELPGRRVLVQSRADGDAERSKILEVLQSALFGDVLLLAVAGGVFAEGVDYPGDMLRAVAVVGPCLPAVTLEQKLLEAHFNERWERGFEYAFVVPGMTRVVQAAGRLIRSPHDRGVIALFDRRFLGGLYKKHLPNDWAGEDGEFEPGHPASVARAFFAESSGLLGDQDEATGA